MTIEPYIMVRSKRNGFRFYHYLVIQGGAGHGKKGMGGRYLFYLFYLAPEEDGSIDACPEYFCKDKGIPCGFGNTIAEAYADFKKKLEKQPLK